ncbi:Fe-S cluster assembly protein SufD [Caulobacter sp. FWC2]|uniref:Fe-S cluster assembly protein SufD n=1 Tax=Caulobacter sp. FWC2 TaxID=69664 RepID=UPI000C159CFB|nr:Fe-S cluster assembly protein SufD [Caulobacter sp. FWC2]PIB92060.1 Fe-S cluster assembly protein SufD [Caulobacter sp. FWC2]
MSLASALKTGDVTELPSRRDEDWRWTDLRGLIRTLPKVYQHAGTGVEGPFRDGVAFSASRTVSVANGYVDGLGGGALVFDVHDPVVALNVRSAGDQIGLVTALKVRVPAGVSGVLLESHVGEGGYLADFRLDITVEDGAALERIVLVDDDAQAVNVVTAEVDLAPGAAYAQTVLTSGARRQRIETRVNHPGAHAQVRLDGVYLLDGQRHADQTTVVTHAGVDGITSQLTKGMVNDQARGVFQGRIVVSPGADQTDARMGHHALILSDKAEIDAKPELLIFADDVSCAHGNTIGALDEEAIFYARQRGIPELEAKAMLTVAFVGEVVERIEHEGAREIAAAWVARKLGSPE